MILVFQTIKQSFFLKKISIGHSSKVDSLNKSLAQTTFGLLVCGRLKNKKS